MNGLKQSRSLRKKELVSELRRVFPGETLSVGQILGASGPISLNAADVTPTDALVLAEVARRNLPFARCRCAEPRMTGIRLGIRAPTRGNDSVDAPALLFDCCGFIRPLTEDEVEEIKSVMAEFVRIHSPSEVPRL